MGIEELKVMINNEKKSHAATMTELHTKTRSIKELILQSEEDRKNIIILQDSLDKLADDRANKAGSDAHHFESLLREEQAKLVKIAQAKKSLENEVRCLSVRIEEIETNSVATSKRTIQKMEVRIEELEVMINNEKKSHAATMTELHTKTRSIKELILQSEEDRKNIIILQDSLDKLNEKIKMYKRQLEEQESISNSNIMRVKKFQRELES